MDQGYRHLSESSDGSANTKSTQTTSFSSNSDSEKAQRQLSTVMELQDSHEDIKFADEEVDTDNEHAIKEDTTTEYSQIKQNCGCGSLTLLGDNNSVQLLCHSPKQKNKPSGSCEEGTSPASLCNCFRPNIDQEPRKEKFTNDNFHLSVSKNPTDSVTSDKSNPTKTSKQTETVRKNRIHQTAKKHKNEQTNTSQKSGDKVPLDEQNSYDACSTWNNASPDTCLDIDTLSTSSKSKTRYIESFQQRDRYINEYQYGNNMMKTLEDRYSRMIDDMNRKQELLKSSLLWLTVMFIVIILCVAVSMIYNITRNKNYVGIADVEATIERHLDAPDVRAELSDQVLCLKCTEVSVDVMSLFSRDDDGRCCVEDLATLSHELKEFFSEDIKNHDNSLINMKQTIYELEQKANYQSFMIDVGESGNVVDLDNVLERTFLKIESNERMINALLERRRSSLHLVGRADGRKLQWQYKSGNMKPVETNSGATISVNGGSYFVYCTIRFICNQIQTDRRVSVGYKLDEVGRRGGPQSLATVEHHCTNGSSTEQDLVLQRIVSVPVNQGKTIRLSVFNHILQYVSNTHDHSFGIFEI